jgi:hypothetical protein
MTRREFVGGFGAEVKFFAAVLVLLTGICAITATASFGDTIDATTPCSVAIQAFGEACWASPCGRAVASCSRSR